MYNFNLGTVSQQMKQWFKRLACQGIDPNNNVMARYLNQAQPRIVSSHTKEFRVYTDPSLTLQCLAIFIEHLDVLNDE